MAGQRKQYPSQARLRELFDYDPEGFLVWRHREDMPKEWNVKYAGERAGCVGALRSGTIRNTVIISNSTYSTRSLIWIYFNGDIENGLYITNKDGNLANCKIENLVIGQKTSNLKLLRPKIGGFYGVRATRWGAWEAKANKKYVGTFSTEIEAATAFDNEKESIDGTRPNNTERNEVKRISVRLWRRKTKTKGTIKCKSGRYLARVRVAGKQKHLGTFDTQEQAARAYNIAAYEHYGEHAVLNDIPDPLGHGDVF